MRLQPSLHRAAGEEDEAGSFGGVLCWLGSRERPTVGRSLEDRLVPSKKQKKEARLFDAVTDPIIGYYSDRCRAKTGSRKPFVLVGGLLLVPCSYFLFIPDFSVGMVYFTFWYMAFYLALTIFIIPYNTWASEFTVDSQDKTLVFSFLVVAGQAGGAIFYLIPLLPMWYATEITPQVLEITVFLGAILIMVGLILVIKFIPDGPRQNTVSMEKKSGKKSVDILRKIKVCLTTFINNKPFLLYVITFMCLGVGYGMWLGLLYIFSDSYLKLGSIFAEVSLWGMVCGAVAIPVWYRLSVFLGKRNAWLVGMVFLMLSYILTSALRPGLSDFYSLFALNMLMTFSLASTNVISLPLLCDVIDYGRLKNNVQHNAMYFSVQALMTKMQLAIGGAMGLSVIGWFGFEVHAVEQNNLALVGLHIGVSWVPALFVGVAMMVISIMPLNEQKVAIVRKRLAQRDLM